MLCHVKLLGRSVAHNSAELPFTLGQSSTPRGDAQDRSDPSTTAVDSQQKAGVRGPVGTPSSLGTGASPACSPHVGPSPMVAIQGGVRCQFPSPKSRTVW